MQSKRQVYRVFYDKETPCWTIQLEGRGRPLTRTTAKAEAVELALKLGRSAELAQVLVHREDGSIETEHTYGEDARAGSDDP